MVQTKAELAEYNRAYRQAHAERLKAQRLAWYYEHRVSEVQSANERTAARRDRLGEHYTEARRIERNLRVAMRAGLSEPEAWQVAIAAECERALHGDHALRGGRFRELIADCIAARPISAKLDEVTAVSDVDLNWWTQEAV